MKSLLFVPGNDRRKMERSLASGADVVILDLEDSVAASRKEEAREATRTFLAENAQKEGVPRLFVRVNPFGSGLIADDIACLRDALPAGIMLPKCGGGGDVRRLNEALDCGPDRRPGVLAIATETAASLFTLGSYAGAADNLVGLTWGAEDLSADLGASTAFDGERGYTDPYRLARTLTLAGAVAAGCAPVDAVYVDFRDEAGLEAECHAARRDGFTAKMAIHPAQVPVINRVFAPSPEEIERAQRIVEAFAAAPGAGVLSIDGEMVDRPHLTRAQTILARVRAL